MIIHTVSFGEFGLNWIEILTFFFFNGIQFGELFNALWYIKKMLDCPSCHLT